MKVSYSELKEVDHFRVVLPPASENLSTFPV